ncbi:MAG: ribosomal protein S18-alanine N-acetyltransferase [Deltaproteobacteria bacterium]|nr:ribosomal protein S18-alanine N-acetyltransferase [Deltaproteobacteria bacterium]
MSQPFEENSFSKLNFRALEDQDMPVVHAIEQRVYDDPWSLQLLSESLKAPMTHSVGVFCGEECVGYAIYQVIFTEGHLLNIAIEKKFQGRGWGVQLLQKIMKDAREIGALYLFLEVRPSNERARKIYETRGFRTLLTREKYYANGEDAILMMKDL